MFAISKKNKIESGIIVSTFILVITLIVYYICNALELGSLSIVIALIFSIASAWGSYYFSDKIVLASCHARHATREEDLKIVKDEPEKRRKFIDRELCLLKPSYYNNLSNYKKVLQQRNTYLKEKNVDPSVLDIWDMQLAHFGSKIIEERKIFIEVIFIYLAVFHIHDSNKQIQMNIYSI